MIVVCPLHTAQRPSSARMRTDPVYACCDDAAAYVRPPPPRCVSEGANATRT